MPIPSLPNDPRNRDELKEWLKDRKERQPGEPLTPREYVMIHNLKTRRPPYSLT
jgi:hypothetical protein